MQAGIALRLVIGVGPLRGKIEEKILFTVALAAFCFLCFVFPVLYPDIFTSSGTKVEVTVISGMSATAAARSIQEAGAVKSADKLVKWMVKYGIDRSLKPGTYLLAPGDEISVANQLRSAHPTALSVTLIPGVRFGGLLRVLGISSEDRERLVGALGDDANFPPELRELLPDAPTDRIAFLLPETYSLAPGENLAAQLVRRASKLWMERIGAEIEPETNREFLAERAILASIVEGEAKAAEERPILAGIFLSRIEKRMPLQSCATVIFCWDEVGVVKKALTYKDLEIDSPFNTYKYHGMPPGPISVPSEGSWISALRPETTDYLFFFATSDGTHIFSRTYDEHLEKQRRKAD